MNPVDFHLIIPARFNSSRLPGKLLLQLGKYSILEHVYRRCLLAQPKSLSIATDSSEISEVAQGFGATVVMTSTKHPSGSDRLAEAAEILGLVPEAIIVNVQGDEPQIDPRSIQQVAGLLTSTQADWASLYWPIEDYADWINPNVVKVVMNANKEALYFSRSPIPYYRDQPQQLPNAYRHIGLYAYRHQSLQTWVKAPSSDLEQFECLEQLRALTLGLKIQMAQAAQFPGQDINTQADYEKMLANR